MTDILKTLDFSLFKFRKDNRQEINENHVKKLIESIKNRNLLEFRPIIINNDYEVMDGQHRLMAAKSLGVDIYYKIEKKIKPEDMIQLNLSKSWSMNDYLNFYIQRNFDDYVALYNFMKKNNLSLSIALSIVCGKSSKVYSNFKNGKFKFIKEDIDSILLNCRECIAFIKKNQKATQVTYTSTFRFWKALIKLMNDENFNLEKWNENFQKMVDKFSCRTTWEGYYRIMVDIHNYRNTDKILINFNEN